VLENVPMEASARKEEIFGPVVLLYSYKWVSRLHLFFLCLPSNFMFLTTSCFERKWNACLLLAPQESIAHFELVNSKKGNFFTCQRCDSLWWWELCGEGSRDFKEAVEEANNTHYGLQSGVFTSDLNKAFYAFEHLEVHFHLL
jgi:hypothetical protein